MVNGITITLDTKSPKTRAFLALSVLLAAAMESQADEEQVVEPRHFERPTFQGTEPGLVRFSELEEPVGLRALLAPVESSCLDAVGYAPEAERLYIGFRTGALYSYEAVPADVYAQLLAAESKGIFFRTNIRGEYEATKVL